MKTISIALLTLFILVSCSKNDKEKETKQQQPQFDLSIVSYEFETIGQEKEDNIRLVTQIKVTNKSTESLYQTLEGFQAEVQKNEKVIVEDLNFDGHSDIRLMQYLPTDESIAYFYWIYDNTNQRFVRSQRLEEKVFSPVVDEESKFLISQWREHDGSWGADFYKFTETFDFVLVKQEINTPIEDDMIKQTIKNLENGVVRTTKDSTYQMEAYLPF